MTRKRKDPTKHPPRWGAGASGDRKLIVYAKTYEEADAILEAHTGEPALDIHPLPPLLDERPLVQEGRVTHVTEAK
jgi:hypothetical protein